MAAETKIEWADHTASPWYGCQHAELQDGTSHPGCAHCYAEALAKRNPQTLGVWSEHGTRVVSKSFARNCRAWNKAAAASGVRSSVFPSLCDPFEDWPGKIHESNGDEVFLSPEGKLGDFPSGRLATMDDLRRALFALIDECHWLNFLLLTKRPQNVRRMWPMVREAILPDVDPGEWYRPNVLLITSVSDQATADAMIPELLNLRSLVPVLGISAEPLLGPIDLSHLANMAGEEYGLQDHVLDLVIVGGESGPHARPCEVEWIRSIVHQCQAAGVACFVKQLGANVIDSGCTKPGEHWPQGVKLIDTGRGNFKVLLKDSKGGGMSEWPADLCVRQMPQPLAGGDCRTLCGDSSGVVGCRGAEAAGRRDEASGMVLAYILR